MKFVKLFDVKSPSRGTAQSAGIDFFVPNYSEEFVSLFREKNPTCPNDKEGFFIRPHERVLIPAGIKVSIPKDTALIAANKSGTCTKKGLIFGAQVIDADYTGMVHISVINTTSEMARVLYGEKIIQFLLTPIIFSQVEEIESEEVLYSGKTSERGAGGFGSTGV